MSEYKPVPGTAHVFENKNKSNDRSPDYSTNSFEIDGKIYQVSLWGPKTARNGKQFMTVQIKPPFKGSDRPKQEVRQPTRHEEQKANGYQSSSAYVLDDEDAPF